MSDKWRSFLEHFLSGFGAAMIAILVWEIAHLPKQRGVMIELDSSGKVVAIKNTSGHTITNLKFDVIRKGPD